MFGLRNLDKLFLLLYFFRIINKSFIAELLLDYPDYGELILIDPQSFLTLCILPDL